MISKDYKKTLSSMHESSPFGKRAKMPRYLEDFIADKNPSSIIDFGCGKGRLIDKLKQLYPKMTVDGYDPGNPLFDVSLDDRFYDLLISTDVLEHVEPEFIDQTLEYLRSKSRYVYHLIALSPARLILPDGRNAHLIIESKDWWRDRFTASKYKIVKEEYMEHWKIPKGQNKPVLIKKYFLMAET
jgi:2-polyprenyl-3-methyl-5-hydroxy-6-metoxy-1,4-benzoquinol methylase